jgi:hypothetical protein
MTSNAAPNYPKLVFKDYYEPTSTLHEETNVPLVEEFSDKIY